MIGNWPDHPNEASEPPDVNHCECCGIEEGEADLTELEGLWFCPRCLPHVEGECSCPTAIARRARRAALAPEPEDTTAPIPVESMADVVTGGLR